MRRQPAAAAVLLLLAAWARAGIEADGSAYVLRAGDLGLRLNRIGLVTEIACGAAAARGPGGLVLFDDTPPDSGPPVPRALGVPESYLDQLRPIGGHPEVAQFDAASIAGSLLLKVAFAAVPRKGDLVSIYVDRDRNARTGRRGLAAGADIMFTAIVGGKAAAREWSSKGEPASAGKPRVAWAGGTLYLCYPAGLPPGDTVRLRLRASVRASQDGSADLLPWFDATIEPAPPRAPLDGAVRYVTRSGDGLLYVWQSRGDAVVAESVLRADASLRWRVTLRNASARTRFLQAQWRLPVAVRDGRFWDGCREQPPGARAEQAGLARTFPLACAWDPVAGGGLAAGFAPRQLASVLEAGFEPDAAQASLRYGTRLALDPGQSATLELVLFAFGGRFGWRDAVQRYYDLYPDAFEPAAGTDPRLRAAASAFYWTEASLPAEAGAFDGRELVRRFREGWDFGYLPAVRMGDYLVTDALSAAWYGAEHRGVPAAYWLAQQGLPRPPDLAGYVAQTVARVRGGARANVAVGYAASPAWCEQGLAAERFVDGMCADAAGARQVVEPWGHIDQACVRMAPVPGTAWGEFASGQLAAIAARYPCAAVAIETVYGQERNFAAAAQRAPARAYDGARAFVADAVPLALYMDRIHGARTGGPPLAVMANLKETAPFMCAVRTDAAVAEGSLGRILRDPVTAEAEGMRRLMLGHKTISHTVTGLERTRLGVSWDRVSAADLRGLYTAYAEDVLLLAFWRGYLPSARTFCGIPRVVRALDRVRAVARQGWEPAPGFEADARLLTARFGKQAGAALTLGNTGGDDIDTDVRAFGAYFGGLPVLAADDGAPTPQRLEAGLGRLSVKVPGRRSVVLRAVLCLPQPADAVTRVTASLDARPGERAVVEARIESGAAELLRAEAWVPEGYSAGQVEVDGQPVAFEPGGDGARDRATVRFGAVLPRGVSILRVVCRPRIGLLPDRAAVASFDFVRDGRPACVLAVGPDATAAERAEAERIGAFFRFWYAHTPPADARRVDVEEVRRPGNPYRAWQFAYDGRRAPFRDVRIAVTASPADSPPGLARVVVGCRGRHPDLDRAGAFGAPPEQAGTIWREGNTLFVAGSDLAALRATVDLLLTVLEERYPYDGVFTDSPTPFGRMALPPNPLAVRAGLAGRTLE